MSTSWACLDAPCGEPKRPSEPPTLTSRRFTFTPCRGTGRRGGQVRDRLPVPTPLADGDLSQRARRVPWFGDCHWGIPMRIQDEIIQWNIQRIWFEKTHRIRNALSEQLQKAIEKKQETKKGTGLGTETWRPCRICLCQENGFPSKIACEGCSILLIPTVIRQASVQAAYNSMHRRDTSIIATVFVV